MRSPPHNRKEGGAGEIRSFFVARSSVIKFREGRLQRKEDNIERIGGFGGIGGIGGIGELRVLRENKKEKISGHV